METVKGKKQLKRRGCSIYTPKTLQSVGKKSGHSSLLGQKFQDLIGEESNCNFDPLQKHCDNESSHRHRGLPLVQQLQQLIGEDPNTNVDPLHKLHDNESSHRHRRLPLAQQLQVLIGENPNATVDPLQIGHDNELSHIHKGLPLVRQLQELIGEEHNAKFDPPHRRHDNESSRVHRGLPLVQQLQELIGEETNSNSDPLQRRCDDESSSRYKGLPVVQKFQVLVQEAPLPLLDPSQSLGRKVSKRIVTCGTKAVNSLETSRPVIQEEIVESLDSDNDAQEGMYDEGNPVYRRRHGHSFHHDSDIPEDILEALDSDEGNVDQKTNIIEEGTSGFPVNSVPIIWERFQSALESAPPETNTTFNSRHNSKEPMTFTMVGCFDCRKVFGSTPCNL